MAGDDRIPDEKFPRTQTSFGGLVAGPVKARIDLWDVPTQGSRPHDPRAAKDGSIWWTGQLANKLGRIDPKTGAIREYTLKSPHTGPHGLAEDKDGNIWFTGNNLGLIGKLDPQDRHHHRISAARQIGEGPAHHQHRARRHGVVHRAGRQHDRPARSQIRRHQARHPADREVAALWADDQFEGRALLVEFGAPKIASVDPQNMAIKEYKLPNDGARPRRLAFSDDDTIWYTDFARGMLGRLDLKTGNVKEWQSPSGPKSEPYGIVFTKGALWYNESGARPNTIVRFDPASEKFQSWAIPGGGDIVRNMDVTPDGNPVTANSLTNQVGLVTVEDSK